MSKFCWVVSITGALTFLENDFFHDDVLFATDFFGGIGRTEKQNEFTLYRHFFSKVQLIFSQEMYYAQTTSSIHWSCLSVGRSFTICSAKQTHITLQ